MGTRCTMQPCLLQNMEQLLTQTSMSSSRAQKTPISLRNQRTRNQRTGPPHHRNHSVLEKPPNHQSRHLHHQQLRLTIRETNHFPQTMVELRTRTHSSPALQPQSGSINSLNPGQSAMSAPDRFNSMGGSPNAGASGTPSRHGQLPPSVIISPSAPVSQHEVVAKVYANYSLSAYSPSRSSGNNAPRPCPS